jgi:hypothetical protein
VYVEPSLHPWDETDLIMVYDLSDVHPWLKLNKLDIRISDIYRNENPKC